MIKLNLINKNKIITIYKVKKRINSTLMNKIKNKLNNQTMNLYNPTLHNNSYHTP